MAGISMPSLKNKHLCYMLLCALCQHAENNVAQSLMPNLGPDTPVNQGTVRLMYETLSLPAHEKIGWVGGTFLYNITDHWSIGPAAFGALSGNRGGFIVIGATLDGEIELSKMVSLNSGFSFGGGGGKGGYLLTGGGAMFRPYTELNWHLGSAGDLGLGISYVDFLNGKIHSTQPYLTYHYPFDIVMTPGWSGNWLNKSRNIDINRDFSIYYRRYYIPAGVMSTNTTAQYPELDVLGAAWNYYINQHRYLNLALAGALGGQSSGYMQVLAGPGYRFNLTQNTVLQASITAGPAGGGGVDTGGGLLVESTLAAQQYLSQRLYLGINGGYTQAPFGSYRAQSLGAAIGYGYDAPEINDNICEYQPHYLRARLAQQTYIQASDNWRAHHANESVQVFGPQLDYFFAEPFYLTGQGLGAYAGNAGAYMAGLVGAGIMQSVWNSPWFIDSEALVGAAGGGGLSVGSGLVLQANMGLGYQFNQSLSAMTYYSYMSAVSGSFAANVLGFGLGYNFTLFG